MKSIFALSLIIFTAASSFAQEEPTPVEPKAPAHIRQNTQQEIVSPIPPKERDLPVSSNQSTNPRPAVAPPPPQPAIVTIVEPAPEVAQEIVEFPDVEAEFPGGVEAMSKFMAENLVYPETALEMEEQGIVYLSFIVEETGLISNVKVILGVSSELDREAKRVIRLMPKWKPAEVKGKPVRARYQLPIAFKLD